MVARSVRCRASTSERLAAEQVQRTVESVAEIAQGQRREPPGGQFDGQRHPVEPAHDVGDDLRGRPPTAAGPRRTRRARSRKTATDGVRRRSPSAPGSGRGASRELYSDGRPSGSRLVVRTERCGQPARIRPTVSRDGVEQVLAVVDHQHDPARRPGRRRRPTGRRPAPPRGSRVSARACGSAAGSVTGASSSTVAGLAPARDLEGHAGLADATWSDDGHQAFRREQPMQRGDGSLAADQPGRRLVRHPRRRRDRPGGATRDLAFQAASAGVGSRPVSSASRRR